MIIERDVYEKYVKTYAEASVIFEEGDPGNEIFIIIDGEVEIRKRTSATTTKTLIVLHSGDIFGEMAIIEKKPRSALAIATKSVKLLAMNETLLDSMIERNPDFAKKLIRILSERIRKANAIIQNMTTTNRQNQILNGLNDFAAEHGTSTFKGARINVTSFAAWAADHLGINDKEVRVVISGLLKREQVKPSAAGKDEILVQIRKPLEFH